MPVSETHTSEVLYCTLALFVVSVVLYDFMFELVLVSHFSLLFFIIGAAIIVISRNFLNWKTDNSNILLHWQIFSLTKKGLLGLNNRQKKLDKV